MAPSARSPVTYSARHKWFFGFHVLLAVTAALALVGMVNYLSARHFYRLPVAGHRPMALSPQTLRVLAACTNQVKITVFFDTREEEELYELVVALLKEFNYVNPRIVYRTVDPTRHPAQAELVLAAYKLTALKDRNFVLLDCDGRVKVIYQNELAEYRYEPVANGDPREVRKTLAAFKGEMLLTPAIYNLAHPRQYKVYFLTGHGEHDPEKNKDPHGYAKFAEVLREKSNGQWAKLSLRGTNDVPEDCQLLVIAGARLPMEQSELDKIEAYLRQGGRGLVLMNNLALGGTSGLEKLLAKWGVAVGNRIILDPQYSPTGNDLLVARMSDQHAITKALLAGSEDMRVRLVLPRAVGPGRLTMAGPTAPKVEVLATTSERGLEVGEVRNGVPYPNPYRDRQGAFPLIVAVEQGQIPGVTAERGTTRLVVVGDSLCLDNELIDSWPANHYFAALAVDWLLARPQLLLEGLVPRPLPSYQLILTPRQMQTIQWILLAGMPGSVLLLGVLVWWRRRR